MTVVMSYCHNVNHNVHGQHLSSGTELLTYIYSEQWRSEIGPYMQYLKMATLLLLAFLSGADFRQNLMRLGLNGILLKFLVELHRDSGLFLQSFGNFLELNETPIKISGRTHSILAYLMLKYGVFESSLYYRQWSELPKNY